MSGDKKPIGYLKDDALNALKTKLKVKNLHEIVTTDDDEQEHVTYVKKPSLEHIQLLADYAKKSQEIKGLEVLFNTCRVGGSDEVLEDDEMKISAFKALATIFKSREAVIKKR